MSNLTKLNIPKTINVGFNKRSDTYTGMLAFIVYTDAAGVLRKQKSWDRWRDKKIEPKQFDNVPTSGFVLNKKVGDYTAHYGGRMAAIRIYDPRDFEFEIKLDNLLYILEETSAIKGKGLEGEFVYAWERDRIILLPASSREYKASTEFTELQTKKIDKTDMREGCLYLTKDNEQVMYLGRLNWYQWKTNYIGSDYQKWYLKRTREHVFVRLDSEEDYDKYWTQSGFTKLAARLSEEPLPSYADEYEAFKASPHGDEVEELVGKPYTLPSGNDGANYWYNPQSAFVKTEAGFVPVFIDRQSMMDQGPPTSYSWRYFYYEEPSPVVLAEDKSVTLPHRASSYTVGWRSANSSGIGEISRAELDQKELYSLWLKTKSGALIPTPIY